MKGMFKLKKLSAVFITVLMLVHSTMCYAVAYDYSVGKAEFDIPDEFSVLYDEEDMPETEIFRFVDGNNTVELSCYFLSNGDEASFMLMNLTDTVEYFFDNVSAFDYNAFTLESVQTFLAYRSGDGIMFEGTVEKSGSVVPIEAYVFSAEGNIYGFQFLIYNEAGRSYVDEIINSLSFDAYDSSVYEDEDNSTDESDFLTLSYFIILIFSVLSFVFKFFGKNKKNKGEVSDGNKAAPVRSKTELNGKNISKFSVKRSGLDNGDNFAMSELERERKEREKMFQ